MAGHGGLRPGAGRPQGGISQTRRLLTRALTRGLELAGREVGLTGDQETVATEAAAQLAADLIRAGRGDEVLKLLAVVQTKSDGVDPDEDTPLTKALKSLPGLQNVPETHQADEHASEPREDRPSASTRTTDQQSGGRDFATAAQHGGQVLAPSERGAHSPGQLVFAPQRALGLRAPTPAGEGGYPPSPAPQYPFHLSAENFEKIPEGG